MSEIQKTMLAFFILAWILAVVGGVWLTLVTRNPWWLLLTAAAVGLPWITRTR